MSHTLPFVFYLFNVLSIYSQYYAYILYKRK